MARWTSRKRPTSEAKNCVGNAGPSANSIGIMIGTLNFHVSPGETWRPGKATVTSRYEMKLLPAMFRSSTITGVFDSKTDEFKQRFSLAFQNNNHVIHKITGDGTLSMDVDKGRILTKSETLVFTLQAQSKAQQDVDSQPKNVENKPPGTRLISGAVVPEYDDK